MSGISVKNLSFAYKKAQPILRDLSFEIEKGKTVVIAGLSGCGKTTLCNILCGIIPNAVKGSLTGEVIIDGLNLRSSSLAQMSTKVGLVFQDSDNQIVSTTVEDELAFGLENLCVEPGEIRVRVTEMLEQFGLSELSEADPALLSGGQKKLVAMAGILILEPEILILDEPMSNLDVQGRALVRSAIDRLRDRGRSVLIVEHDLSLVTYADLWLILEDGEIAALDTPKNLLSEPDTLKRLSLLFD